MATGNDLIASALRAISSLNPGEAIPGAEAGNALSVLNMMLAAWSADGLMQPCRTIESFPLVVGKQSYTMGPGGDFDTARPDRVTFAFRRDANGLDRTLNAMVKEQYDDLPLKGTGGIPLWYYYDCQYPQGVIYVYPVESTQATLYVESLKPVNQFSSLNAEMILPGEYQEAIKYGLAKRLAPEYGFPIDQVLASLILDAENRIVRKNAPRKAASFDPMFGCAPRPYIYTG